jgi:hypothetical protein
MSETNVIVVDTREQKNHVTKYLDQHDIPNVRSKLFVGDYAILCDQSVAVDRKQHLLEVCSNVTQQHIRFRNELLRAQEAGIHLIILVEHGHGIETIEDVRSWVNPRLKKSPLALSGPALYVRMKSIAAKYGIEWKFCEKHDTGWTVCELLGVEIPK